MNSIKRTTFTVRSVNDDVGEMGVFTTSTKNHFKKMLQKLIDDSYTNCIMPKINPEHIDQWGYCFELDNNTEIIISKTKYYL